MTDEVTKSEVWFLNHVTIFYFPIKEFSDDNEAHVLITENR